MIAIYLEDVLSRQGISVRELSMRADVPYTTMLELVRGKKAVEKAAAWTVYRIARVLDVTVEDMVLGALRDRDRMAAESMKEKE